MMDGCLMRALVDQGVNLPDGTVYLIRYVNTHVHDDEPVLTYLRRNMTNEVVRSVIERGLDVSEGDVTLAVASPDELKETWRREFPMEPPPETDIYGYLAYWTPAKEATPA